MPGQIEEAANELGITPADGKHSAINGYNWVLSEGQTLDEAIAAAKQRYMVERNPFSYLPSDDDDEYKSLSDTSEEEGSFSEYDDDECLDSQVDSSSDKEMDLSSSVE